MKKLLLLCLSVLTASCDTATRQFESRLDEILSGHKAFVGVAARTPGGETIARNDTLLPMMSIFKFPVALAVLDRMQREGIPLTQPISITPDLLLPGTYSPMRDSLPAGGGTARPVQSAEVEAPCAFFAIGKPGCFDNHIHRITCLSPTGHSLHVYSDDALRGKVYGEADE